MSMHTTHVVADNHALDVTRAKKIFVEDELVRDEAEVLQPGRQTTRVEGMAAVAIPVVRGGGSNDGNGGEGNRDNLCE